MKNKLRILISNLKIKFKLWHEKITEPKNVQKIYITSIVIAAVFFIGSAIFGVYVEDYYHADSDAIYEMMGDDTHITCFTYKDGVTLYKSDDCEPTAGFIFYPGGKVEHTAYEPLMYELADRGIVAVLCEMPFNLAVFNMNAADGVREMMPEITEWYIGGHSLGGSMAASYYANNSDWLSGVVLLASYSTKDISDGRVLSIYGSLDGVLHLEKYEKNKQNLPSDKIEIIIEGANHAYFGMYGEQKGDGAATISNESQIILTANYIASFIKE